MTFKGLAMPSLSDIAKYHPQLALAVANGVPLRPDVRPLSFNFASGAVGEPVSQSFATPVATYSLFMGVEVTVDPSTPFAGNPLKGLNDVSQTIVSGVTATIEVQSRDGNYNIVSDDTPLQSLGAALSPLAGIWALKQPDNVKAKAQLATAAAAAEAPLTAWLIFTFAIAGMGCDPYLCMSRDQARAGLQSLGVC